MRRSCDGNREISGPLEPEDRVDIGRVGRESIIMPAPRTVVFLEGPQRPIMSPTRVCVKLSIAASGNFRGKSKSQRIRHDLPKAAGMPPAYSPSICECAPPANSMRLARSPCGRLAWTEPFAPPPRAYLAA